MQIGTVRLQGREQRDSFPMPEVSEAHKVRRWLLVLWGASALMIVVVVLFSLPGIGCLNLV